MTEEMIVLVNPTAGGGRACRIDWHRAFASLCLPYRVEMPTRPADAFSLAAQFCQAVGKVLVVAGGDGTVHAVLPALVNSETALALCPMGTSNVLARELGYSVGRKALSGCVRALQAGQVWQIDVGVFGGTPFVLMVSAGLDAHVVNRVPLHLKKRLGVFAYLWTGMLELRRYQPARYRLRIADEVLEDEAVILVATNTSRYGWFTVIAPHARLDDANLDIVWMPAVRTWRRAIWRVLMDVMTGRASHCPHLRTLKANEVHIEALPPQPAQCDGEAIGYTPLSIRVQPRCLRVIAASPAIPSRSAP